MRQFVYVGGSRFTRFETIDIFTGERIPCSEEEFDNIVVRFRDQFKLEYVPGGQHFFSEDGCEYWRYYK